SSDVCSSDLVDVLHHLLAPLVFKIHVDIRRFVASVAHKTREQQVKFGGIYGSDTQAVADSRVGGRSAPLTEDVPLASETHQIIDGKEIRRIVLPTDEFQLHCQGGAHLFGRLEE